MGDVGELVLVLGDLHIPHRATDVPQPFKQILLPGKVQHILCTGNLTSKEALEWMRNICTDIHCARGDFDDAKDTPEVVTVKLGKFKFGVVHGHQVVPWGDKEALGIMLRKLDVDVLISGHTHEHKSIQDQGKYFLNPGSITGAFSNTSPAAQPSFMLLNLQESSITNFIYTIGEKGDQKLSVRKEIWKKE
eukprot:NODE_4695_length_773_cov_18.245856_g3905_i0.p1 GENE.NODE_4695_length_773_cov_18.245856_g3905_i0~~NODE_4695_length_773_cov_18.245856_g3905_i0.p1  ORF type:complete len:191 (+),score=53.51 NODE_4695_length_773_cov_18.245856_g3905_i0:162-734(+)